MNQIGTDLSALIKRAELFGLNNSDINHAKEYIGYHEYGLCLDTIVTQMFEFKIGIDAEFYNQIEKIAKSMKMNEEEYSFMKKLIMN